MKVLPRLHILASYTFQTASQFIKWISICKKFCLLKANFAAQKGLDEELKTIKKGYCIVIFVHYDTYHNK